MSLVAPATLEVDSSDVIKVMMQFCKENGLLGSLRALQEETQVTLNTVDNVDKFTMDILQGRWDAVLEVVSTLRLPTGKLIDLFEQIILELAELRELDAARSILRSTPAMQACKKEQAERFLRLEHLLQRTFFDYTEAYPGGTNKERRRQEISQALKPEVSVVPPSRLLSLITQALKWQQYQGMLPKGTKFDLFRGAAQMAATTEEESFPTKNTKVIKFGKSSHPEVAKFSPDGLWLVSGSSDGFVEVWDYESGKLAKDLKYQAEDDFMMHEDSVLSLGFSRDSELLATGDSKGRLKVWRLRTGACLRKFPSAHAGGITCLDFARDGTQIATGSFDQTVRVHGLKSGRTLKEFRGHNSYIHAVLYNEDQSLLLSGSADGTIKVWDGKTTDCIRTFKPNPAAATSPSVVELSWMPRMADRLLVASRANSLRMCNVEGQLIQSLQITGPGDVSHQCVSPKGNFVYAVSDDHVLYAFTAESGKVEHVMKLHEKEVSGIAHHPHRNVIVSFSHDGTIKVWRP